MTVQTPGFRERVIRLAEKIRERFADISRLENIAEASDIVLVRSCGPEGKDAGFAYIHHVSEPLYVESLARPGELVRVWGQEARVPVRSIVINTNSGIPEREIFWHEYYHLFHSPIGVQRSERFEHRYSTEGVLHHQEERRADEFAAAVLLHPIGRLDDSIPITEHFGVSERLARCALRLRTQIAANELELHTLAD